MGGGIDINGGGLKAKGPADVDEALSSIGAIGSLLNIQATTLRHVSKNASRHILDCMRQRKTRSPGGGLKGEIELICWRKAELAFY